MDMDSGTTHRVYCKVLTKFFVFVLQSLLLKLEKCQFALTKAQEEAANTLLQALTKYKKLPIAQKSSSSFAANIQRLAEDHREYGPPDLDSDEEEEEGSGSVSDDGGKTFAQNSPEIASKYPELVMDLPKILQSRCNYFEGKGYCKLNPSNAHIGPLLHKFSLSLFATTLNPASSPTSLSNPLLVYVITKHYTGGKQWSSPDSITPVLAKLKYSIRTTIFCKAIDSSIADPNTPHATILQFVQKGTRTVFAWLSEQQTRISNMVFNTPTRIQFLPCSNDPAKFLFNGELLHWSDFQQMAQAVMSKLEKLLTKLYGKVDISPDELPLGPCTDDLNDLLIDHCFLDHASNTNLNVMKTLLLWKLLANKAYVQKDSTGAVFWDKIAWLDLEAKIIKMNWLVMTATYLLSSGVAHRMEVAQMLWKNGPGQPHNWVWSDGNRLWLQTYMKTSSVCSTKTIIAHAQPPHLSFILYHLLVGIHPVELFIQAKFGDKTPEFLQKFDQYMWFTGGKVLDTDNISSILCAFTK
jgi:hypothetical protein